MSGSIWLPSGCNSLKTPQLRATLGHSWLFLLPRSSKPSPFPFPCDAHPGVPPSLLRKSAEIASSYLASLGSHRVPALDCLLPGGDTASVSFSISHSLDFLPGTWLGPWMQEAAGCCTSEMTQAEGHSLRLTFKLFPWGWGDFSSSITACSHGMKFKTWSSWFPVYSCLLLVVKVNVTQFFVLIKVNRDHPNIDCSLWGRNKRGCILVYMRMVKGFLFQDTGHPRRMKAAWVEPSPDLAGLDSLAPVWLSASVYLAPSGVFLA